MKTFNEYYTAEHNRLLNLWKDVMSMKRAFLEVRSTTEQDLAKIRSDMSNSTQEMNSACSNLAHSFEHNSKSDVRAPVHFLNVFNFACFVPLGKGPEAAGARAQSTEK
jgi:hypothetical protein